MTDPRTGAEWERIGVQPSVRIEQEKALETAQLLALKTIAADASEAGHKTVVEGLREALEAQLNPRTLSETELASHVGEFDGGRRVSLRGGQLYYSGRPGAPADALIPLGEGRFAIGELRLTFVGAGATARLEIMRPGEGRLSYGRAK